MEKWTVLISVLVLLSAFTVVNTQGQDSEPLDDVQMYALNNNVSTEARELLAQIDARIIEIGKEKNIDASGLCMLRNRELGSIVAVNNAPPRNLLEYKLQNGDEIDIVFGFCGG